MCNLLVSSLKRHFIVLGLTTIPPACTRCPYDLESPTRVHARMAWRPHPAARRRMNPPSALRPPAAFQAHRRTSISSAWPVCSSAAWCMGRGLATQPGDDPLDFFIHNHRNSYTSTQRDDKSNIKITFYKLPVIFHNAFWCLSIPLDFGTYVSLYSDPLKKCLWHSCRLKASSWCKRNRSHLMKFQQSLAFTIEWWKLVGNRNE